MCRAEVITASLVVSGESADTFSVTSIKKVKDVCKEQVKLYDDCLSKNNDDPKSCLAALKNLYNCTRMNSPQ